MRTPEARIKDQVKAFLKERGAYFFMPVPTGYGTPALDFIGCHEGRFFAVETKSFGKRPTPRQMYTMSKMCEAGAVCFYGYDAEIMLKQMALFFDGQHLHGNVFVACP